MHICLYNFKVRQREPTVEMLSSVSMFYIPCLPPPVCFGKILSFFYILAIYNHFQFPVVKSWVVKIIDPELLVTKNVYKLITFPPRNGTARKNFDTTCTIILFQTMPQFHLLKSRLLASTSGKWGLNTRQQNQPTPSECDNVHVPTKQRHPRGGAAHEDRWCASEIVLVTHHPET